MEKTSRIKEKSHLEINVHLLNDRTRQFCRSRSDSACCYVRNRRRGVVIPPIVQVKPQRYVHSAPDAYEHQNLIGRNGRNEGAHYNDVLAMLIARLEIGVL